MLYQQGVTTPLFGVGMNVWQGDQCSDIIAAIGALIVVMDRQGSIVFFNRACEEATGYTSTEVQGRIFFDFLLVPEEVAGVRRIFSELSAGQFPNRHENDWVAKNGIRRRILWSNTALLDPQGEVQFVVGTGIDVTERRRVELQIERAKQEWELTFDAVPDLIAIIDTNHRIVRVNQALADRAGRSPSDLVGTACCEVLHGHAHSPSGCPLTCLIDDGRARAMEVEMERLGGYFLVSVTPLCDASGAVWGAVHVARDVTEKRNAEAAARRAHDELEVRVAARTSELASTVSKLQAEIVQRRRSEAALREAELRYRTVADFTHDWEYWEAPDGQMRYVSPACLRVTGYEPSAFAATPSLLADIVLPEDQAVWQVHLKGTRAQQQGGTVTFRILRLDGVVRWIEHACQPITAEDGAFLGFRGSNRDVTERYLAEAEIVRQREELAHIGRVNALGELVASLAHEINQPLTATLNNAETALLMLSRPESDRDELREILQDIAADGNRARDIMTRLRAMVQRDSTPFETLNMAVVVEEALRLLHGALVIGNVRIETQLEAGLPFVSGDRVQLLQVLINLINNALQALVSVPAERRTVIVRTSCHAPDTVETTVSDTGPGIDPTNIDRILEPFFTTRQEGLGMGLAICRSIVTAHSGRLWAVNNPEGGATFGFCLPVTKETKKKEI